MVTRDRWWFLVGRTTQKLRFTASLKGCFNTRLEHTLGTFTVHQNYQKAKEGFLSQLAKGDCLGMSGVCSRGVLKQP